MKPTAKDAIRSLQSTVCPICGGSKKPRMTMCYRDYKMLPVGMQKNLYRRVGAGYEQAIEAAMQHLNVTEFVMPSPVKAQHG